jgi:hypothetical protein
MDLKCKKFKRDYADYIYQINQPFLTDLLDYEIFNDTMYPDTSPDLCYNYTYGHMMSKDINKNVEPFSVSNNKYVTLATFALLSVLFIYYIK